jgi:mannose-6-phosphate isomerase-like protein (cupin superfamily)
MAVRRVVTGVDGTGRSVFLSDGDADGRAAFGTEGLWLTDPARGLDAVAGPDTAYATLEPPPGGTSWRVFDLPTDEAVAEYLAGQGVADADAAGFHTTETIDYVMILDGEVTLELDDGSVDLKAGDCVVQRGTNHAWRNHSGRPVRMMVVMVSTRDGKEPT